MVQAVKGEQSGLLAMHCMAVVWSFLIYVINTIMIDFANTVHG